MSTLKTINVIHPSGSVNNIVNDASGNVTIGGTVTAATHIGGTAASSSLTLQSTSGVGTTDSILLKVGNNGATTAMTVDTSGNVGIGTSTPSTYGKLTVNGNIVLGPPASRNSSNTNAIGIYTTGDPTDDSRANISFNTVAGASSSSSYIAFNTNNYGVSAGERMRIDSSGNVGIGTSAPFSNSLTNSRGGTARYLLGDTSQTTDKKYWDTVSTGGVLYMRSLSDNDTNSTSFMTAERGGTGTNWIVSAVTLNTAGSERMRIDSSGNVGIGTSSPSGILDARGNVYLGSTSGAFATYIRGTVDWNYAGLNVTRNASNTSTPRLIGMPLDGDSLTSTTIGGYNAIWGVYNASPTTGSTSSSLQGEMAYAAYYGHRWYINGTESMRIDSSGNVGIGTSTPSASAILDAQSTTKGVRFPNMTTTQKNAVSSPAAGVVVFDTTLAKLCVYSGSAWQTITSV